MQYQTFHLCMFQSSVYGCTNSMMLPGALFVFSLLVACLFAFICSLVVYVYRASTVCSFST